MKDLLEEGDVPLKDEEDYMDLVEKGRYDVIFADPCMKRMTKDFSGVFVDAVHLRYPESAGRLKSRA